MIVKKQKEPFLTISKIAKKRKEEFFLVGGFLRDKLLEKASKDIDFAISKDPIGFARDVSNKLKGAFVLLDENCGRVVLKDLTLDFTKLEGDIEKDIKRRDFTINSLAIKGPDF
ncbi:MAG: CCA tRNA nucleotidyltransferase, partial [bacterium]